MQKFFVTIAFFFITGCSVGGVELTKEAVFCEFNDEIFSPGETVLLTDDCNFCICSDEGRLENCTEIICAPESSPISLVNPAAVKCSVDGFSYEIRTNKDGSQLGVCIDEQNKECDAWAYFREECFLGELENKAEIIEPEIVEVETLVEEVENTDPEISNEEITNIECEDSCCESSLNIIRENRYKITNSVEGCGEGEVINSLWCETSLKWCEPKNN